MFETLKIFRMTLGTIRDYRVLALAVVLHPFCFLFFLFEGVEWGREGRNCLVLLFEFSGR